MWLQRSIGMFYYSQDHGTSNKREGCRNVYICSLVPYDCMAWVYFSHSGTNVNFLRQLLALTPQYSSSLNSCGGRGERGLGSLTVAPFDFELFCINSLSASRPGSVMSMMSYLMFFESNIIKTRCCLFFTWNYGESRNQKHHRYMNQLREKSKKVPGQPRNFLILNIPPCFRKYH